MWLVSISRAVALLILVEVAMSIRRHGWASYWWPAQLCMAGCFLLVEPRREGETTWTRLRRPRQAAIFVLAVVGMVLIVLSMVSGSNT
ncbi:hypothetical protein SBA7_290023 [Candidatus Sulfotelmatobacter sp. SbA7]|jgi:hypothetical protein|nr:hypothetical protein SBA7_290023 [Candidatus Sulfotelmatobacter sp. SbA7]